MALLLTALLAGAHGAQRAPDGLAPLMNAPLMNAPLMNAPLMNAPLMSAPLMSAPLMSAPLMSAPPMLLRGAAARSAPATGPASTGPRPTAAGAVLAATGSPVENPALLRRVLGEVALAQVKAFDPAWSVEQRDCAGFVRFVYRQAFKQLVPSRLAAPLFVARDGQATDFVDAENLVLGKSFSFLGRDAAVRERLLTGDVLAFRLEREGGDVFHLMLVVRPADRAHADARVVYHPGEPGAAVRQGALDALAREAPHEWRPVADNPAFLGFYRFTEWTR